MVIYFAERGFPDRLMSVLKLFAEILPRRIMHDNCVASLVDILPLCDIKAAELFKENSGNLSGNFLLCQGI